MLRRVTGILQGEKSKNRRQDGFSLIELLVVIVAFAIVASIAMQSMTSVGQDTRQTKTEREMEMLAGAIVGNPGQTQGNQRSDFGYVGDVGAFPANLQALYQNPGAYATWDGPYIASGYTQDSTGFKLDEWGTLYSYSGGTMINSTGSGATIGKKVADATDDYLLNTINGTILDAANEVPGTDYLDSIDVVITYPNGAGSMSSKTYAPDSAGAFTLDSIPVGTHLLQLIYIPDVDTLTRYVTVLPRHRGQPSYRFASAYFGAGGGGGSGGGSGVETLRPIGSGSQSNLSSENCSINWQCVDESSSDGDGTYVKGAGSNWLYDLYSTQDHTTGSGTIDSVIIVCYAKGNGGGKKARTYLRTNSSNYGGSFNNTTGSYVEYSTVYASNPNTSSAWSWAEIDALEIGTGIKKEAFVTQVWVEVYYTD